MSTPIKSTSTLTSTTSTSQGGAPALNELMGKLQAQAGGEAGEQQLAFSKWMAKHAIAPEAKASAAPKAPPSAHSPSAGASAAQLAEQALARTRQQAMAAAKPAETVAGGGSEKAVQARHEPGTAKAPAKTASKTPGKAAEKAEPREDKLEDKDDDTKEVPFSTAMGEGAAVVRELTPPSTIQPGDAAGMMAWLASLTHGDGGQAKAALGTEGELGDDSRSSAQAGGDAAADARSTPGAVMLDQALWQSTGGAAALQVDALLGAAGKGDKLDADPLAGLMGQAGLKGAGGFGQVLQGTTQTVRHESATLNVPFGSTDFAQALAEKVSMWVGATRADGAMTAELHLNPAEMGPINVKISLDGQSATVDFAAAALETRQAIEASMSMLSSALSDVGLSLSGGGVSSQTSQQAFEQAFREPQGASGRGHGGDDTEEGAGPDGAALRPVAAPRPGRLGGLDLYA